MEFQLWKSLFKLCFIKIHMIYVYDLELVGQTKRIDRSLKDMLRMYVGEKNQ